MEKNMEIEIEDSNFSSNNEDINFKKYVKPYEIQSYSVNNLTNDEKKEKIIISNMFLYLKRSN